jgi:hypothetical protein
MRNDVAAGMQALCESVIAGYGARKITLAFVTDASNTIRGDARLFIGQCRILRRQKANALSKELAETRSDLLGAGWAWRAMAAELKERRGKNEVEPRMTLMNTDKEK